MKSVLFPLRQLGRPIHLCACPLPLFVVAVRGENGENADSRNSELGGLGGLAAASSSIRARRQFLLWRLPPIPIDHIIHDHATVDAAPALHLGQGTGLYHDTVVADGKAVASSAIHRSTPGAWSGSTNGGGFTWVAA